MDTMTRLDTLSQSQAKTAPITTELVLREAPLRTSERVSDGSPESLAWKLEIAPAAGGAVLASACIAPSESTQALASLSFPAFMSRTASAVFDVTLTQPGAATAALAYALGRRARMANRTSLILPADTRSAPLRELGKFEPCSGQLSALYTQRVDLLTHYADLTLSGLNADVAARLRALEVADTVRGWLSSGRNWGLFRATHARTLTRRQYVYAMSNIYQFVRHTTRLLARCIAHSPTTEMRSHFIHHLNGEVNHELIIERDLQYLGEDVAFVRDHMAPNGPTQEFMAIQESMIGYYQDPILLMASPMAAEGVTAHLDQEFVDALHDCMRAWGVPKPEKASKFFVSHMHTDGGEDGHWELTVAFLSSCLTDEPKHQFFVRSMRNAMRGTQRLYDSFVEEIPSWVLHTEAPVDRKPPAVRA